MTLIPFLKRGLPVACSALLVALIASCATSPVPDIRRSALAPGVGQAGTGTAGSVDDPSTNAVERAPQAVIRRGTGQVINRAAASAPPPSLAGATTGSATFNFEGESLQAVAKAILGDMLGQNYVIAPGVQGTVTLATPKPVSPAEALNLLEMVLGWNNARLVYTGGRYNIVPADQALAGTVAPRTGGAANARGFEVRVVPLKFVSATEMKKLLEPYARPNAIVNVDNARNVITLGGSRSELENYLRTVEIFDVDWLAGMSVGVFPIQNGRATQVVSDLEKVFGEQSKSPVAGLFRFMPLDGANAVLVITPQERYLDQIRDWLQRIDNAGGGVRLFSYELKYIKAKDLSDRLAEVFGSGRRNSDSSASLAPGADGVQIGDAGAGRGDAGSSNGSSNGSLEASEGLQLSGNGASGSPGSGAGGAGGASNTPLELSRRRPGNGAVTLEIEGDKVGVSAVEETNTLLVRSTPQAWHSIQEIIQKLDVVPMQVHIEAQVAEVNLTGDLSYGVSWYFENAVPSAALFGGKSAVGRGIWGDTFGQLLPAGPDGSGGVEWRFLGKNGAAVIKALDAVTNVRLLQTPSVMVRNNAEATLIVGDRIPIVSTSVSGIGDGVYGSVQYVDTGVILKVRPRITRDGTVFMEIVQEVSSASAVASNCTTNCNPTISTRRLKTEAALQDGETIMLAGLISDGNTQGSSGVPGLSRLPIIGGLFGQRTDNTKRNEVIVLLTPRILHNPQEARDLTDEYGAKFRALEPIRKSP